jgi:AraC family transcriptional regulator, transcriptional activator of pobA
MPRRDAETRQADIPVVSFQKRKEEGLEFEVVRLGKLFQRRFRRPLDEPQRLGFYQVFQATQGEGMYTVDFKTHTFRKGDIVFAAPGQVQRFHPSPDVDGVMLVFTEGFFIQESSDQKLLGSSHLFDPWSASPVVRHEPRAPFGFRAAFQAIEGEYRKGGADAFREPLLRSMLRTILLQAERIKESAASPAFVAQFPRFLLFKNSVERNFRSIRKVSGYAADLGISVRNLNRVTRIATGLEAKDFIDARVMLELKRLLAHTDEGLKEIAAAVGFDEPTNLVKYFRQRLHLTPMEFRVSSRARGAFLP